MTQTIIGVFTSLDQANAAMTAFANTGLADKEHMRISANENENGYGYDGQTADSGTAVAPTYPSDQPGGNTHTGVLASIEHFFAHLFGGDDRPESAAHYHEAVIRGSTLLAVDVEDETQIDTIEAELKRAGAVDIDAQVARWQTDGYIGQTQNAVPPISDLAPQARDAFANVESGAALSDGLLPGQSTFANDADLSKTPKI